VKEGQKETSTKLEEVVDLAGAAAGQKKASVDRVEYKAALHLPLGCWEEIQRIVSDTELRGRFEVYVSRFVEAIDYAQTFLHLFTNDYAGHLTVGTARKMYEMILPSF